MEQINFIKTGILSMIGAFSAFFVSILGGWDSGLQTLLIFMATDYITGIIVAAVFKKSNKTETGALSSKAGFAGLAKKCMILLYVLIAYRLDSFLGTVFVRNAVIIGYILNEAVSITENAGLMGVPLPAAINKAIDLLRAKADDSNA